MDGGNAIRLLGTTFVLHAIVQQIIMIGAVLARPLRVGNKQQASRPFTLTYD